MIRRLLALMLVSVLALVGCSSPAATKDSAVIPEGAVVVDVRTPEEYAAGHLDGALNIDWNDPAVFETEFAKLPKDDSYALYCRSGNRSAQATARMQELGFQNVIDAGAYEDLK